MTRICLAFLFLFAISLAFLPASSPQPVKADPGTLTKIALRGDPLPISGNAYRPPVSTLYDFGPVDVNDAGEVVFFSQYLEDPNVCALLHSSGGAPTMVKASQDNSPIGGQRYSFCPVLGIPPLTNDDTVSDIAFNSWLETSLDWAIFVATGPSPYTFYKVVREGDGGGGGSLDAPILLLDFNDDGDVLFSANVGGNAGVFVATGGPPTYTITKVVLEGDTLEGHTVDQVGDASMNNDGEVAFQVVLDGTNTILRWDGGTSYVEVVKEGDEWKLGEAYSGGEAHHAHSRFVDTFATVSEPRITDERDVSYYATTAGGEEGFFIATWGSEYAQAKQAAKDDPSIVGLDGFSGGFGGRGRHNLDGGGNLVSPGTGGDPIEAVLAFPSFHKIVIGGEVAPGTTGDKFKEDTGTFKLPVVSYNGGNVGFTADTDSSGPGVWAGTVNLKDEDGDGILDKWEQPGGWDYNNDTIVDLNLYDLGARDDHKDIFVEIDYMDCTIAGSDCDDHDHEPLDEAIEDVEDAFDDAPVNNPDLTTGIHLHVSIDDALPHSRFMNFAGSLLEDPESATPGPCNDGIDNGEDGDEDEEDDDCTAASVDVSDLGEDGYGAGTCDDDTDNGNDGTCDVDGCGVKLADPDCLPADFDAIKANSFGSAGDSKHTLAAKTRVFHYAIFGHSLFPDNTATSLWEDTISGYAELPGNDLIVTLGEWDSTAGEQEGTFMHELGHNLGLDHGGGDSMNYKPNYLSVMNYTFQMPNIVSDRPLDYSRWVLPLPDNEDSQGSLNTCNDNSDNGGEGACDVAGGCGAALPADLDCQPFLHETPPVEDAGQGSCDDGIDNGHGDGADEADSDCQQGLDEGRGIDGNKAPTGLSNWSTAYTYRRIDPTTGQASCPFAVVDAVGDIDWDVDGAYTGISLDKPTAPSANTGAGISDPDPGPSAPQAALCLNSTSTLQGYDDWANLKYVKGFAESPDFSVDDHFTQPPEMAQKQLPDTDTDGIADIADNCPDDSNAGQEDGDGDQVGNICDNCPSVWNADQADSDDNGIGDVCDFPVGGTAELPDVSGSSSRNYVALAGLAAVATAIVAAGAWCARRRWSK